jgi:hypothetical protein
MVDITKYKKKFYKLIESSLGNSKPIIFEQEESDEENNESCTNYANYQFTSSWTIALNNFKTFGYTEEKENQTCGRTRKSPIVELYKIVRGNARLFSKTELAGILKDLLAEKYDSETFQE